MFAVFIVFVGSRVFSILQTALVLISDKDAAESINAVVLFLCGVSLQPGGDASLVVVRLLTT